MEIHFKTIPHREQRYETVGDYFYDEEGLQFRVSEMNDKRYSFLVFIHELIEWFLVDREGIKIDDIDAFDIEYEKNRKPGDVSEPGNDPKAPYYKQHQIATLVERVLASLIGVDWEEYDKEVVNL